MMFYIIAYPWSMGKTLFKIALFKLRESGIWSAMAVCSGKKDCLYALCPVDPNLVFSREREPGQGIFYVRGSWTRGTCGSSAVPESFSFLM